MASEFPYAEDFQKKHLERIPRYETGEIFLENPLEGLEGIALKDAQRIKEIAEQNGFRISEIRAGNGPIARIIIGDEHGVPGSKDFLRYHPNIANIIRSMVGEGMLSKGDAVCYEGNTEGEVDYCRSHAKAIRVGEKTVNLVENFFLVELLDTLNAAGIKSVCNDKKRYRDEVETMNRSVTDYLSKAKAASSDEENKRYNSKAYEAGLMRDTMLLARIKKGIAEYLANNVPEGRKAVQVFGVTDVFTDMVQEKLEKKDISYMVLLPQLNKQDSI